MATASLTTSPTTIDTGSSDNVSVTNTGTVDVVVSRGAQSFTLRPTQGRVIYPEGTAVTAAAVSGTGSVSYTATAARQSQAVQFAADPAFTGTYGQVASPVEQFARPHGLSATVVDRSRLFLCWGQNGEIVAADLCHRNTGAYTLIKSTDNGVTWTNIGAPDATTSVPVAWTIPTTNTLIASYGNVLYRSSNWTTGSPTFSTVLTMPSGVSALASGLDKHTDGHLYLASYSTTVGAYPSGNATIYTDGADDGATWSAHSSLPSTMDGSHAANAIRHWHAVKSTSVGLLAFSGDLLTEAGWWFWSGSSWTRVTPSASDFLTSQKYRTVGVTVRNGYLYSVGDTGGASPGAVWKAPVASLNAPVADSAITKVASLPVGGWMADQLSDGTIIVGTDIEYNSSYEQDNVLRLWSIDSNDYLREIATVRNVDGQTTGYSRMESMRCYGSLIGMDMWNTRFGTTTIAPFNHVMVIGSLAKGQPALAMRPADSTSTLAGGSAIRPPARTFSANIYAPGRAWATSTMTGLNIEHATDLWIPDDISINALAVDVTSAGSADGSVYLAIRRDSNGPGTLLYAASVNITSTGVKSVNLSPTLLVARGLYWVSATLQGFSATRATIVTRNDNSEYVPQGSSGSIFTTGRNGLAASGVTGAPPTEWTGGNGSPTVTAPVVWLTRS